MCLRMVVMETVRRIFVEVMKLHQRDIAAATLYFSIESLSQNERINNN